MHRSSGKIKSYKAKSLAIALSILFCHIVSAQQHQRLPDSIRVSDTVFGSGEHNEENADVVATGSDSTAQKEPDSVVFRSIPDSVVSRYRKDKDFAYANNPAYWLKEPVKEDKNFWYYLMNAINSIWFRGSLYVLLGAVLLFALYKIVVENRLYLFYSSPKKTREEQTAETIADNIDLESSIQEAIAANDFRSAVRYMHLKTLRLLNDKGLIELHAQATDQQYIDQLQNHSQGKIFRALTNAYEYVWYGGFVPTQEQFGSLQKQFENFYNSIGY